jgi:hypothetical protein
MFSPNEDDKAMMLMNCATNVDALRSGGLAPRL